MPEKAKPSEEPGTGTPFVNLRRVCVRCPGCGSPLTKLATQVREDGVVEVRTDSAECSKCGKAWGVPQERGTAPLREIENPRRRKGKIEENEKSRKEDEG